METPPRPALAALFVLGALAALAALRASRKPPRKASSRRARAQSAAQALRARLDGTRRARGPRATLWIGVCGVPGSGKTTFAADLEAVLIAEFGLKARALPMDGYHYERRVLDAFPDPAEAHRRRGAPFTFDAKRFVNDLKQAPRSLIEQGETAYFPSFDHALKDPKERAINVDSSVEIVIVEGNYLLLDEPHWREIPSLLDHIYFLDVDLDSAKSRLAKRHAQAWNWPLEKAMHRVEDSDFHNMVLVDRTKSRANEILPDTT